MENTAGFRMDDVTFEKLMADVKAIWEKGAFDLFSRLFQSDYRILSYLSTHKDAHPSIIADELQLTRPTVAANLRLLESKKYIVRIGDENNHRQVFVNITETGLRYLNVIFAKCRILFSNWFEILGEEEVKHLFNILEITTQDGVISPEIRQFNFDE